LPEELGKGPEFSVQKQPSKNRQFKKRVFTKK
jgi:hypothetical protein